MPQTRWGISAAIFRQDKKKYLTIQAESAIIYELSDEGAIPEDGKQFKILKISNKDIDKM